MFFVFLFFFFIFFLFKFIMLSQYFIRLCLWINIPFTYFHYLIAISQNIFFFLFSYFNFVLFPTTNRHCFGNFFMVDCCKSWFGKCCGSFWQFFGSKDSLVRLKIFLFSFFWLCTVLGNISFMADFWKIMIISTIILLFFFSCFFSFIQLPF